MHASQEPAGLASTKVWADHPTHIQLPYHELMCGRQFALWDKLIPAYTQLYATSCNGAGQLPVPALPAPINLSAARPSCSVLSNTTHKVAHTVCKAMSSCLPNYQAAAHRPATSSKPLMSHDDNTVRRHGMLQCPPPAR